MRTTLFSDITQQVVAISYRRFGITSRSHLQGSRTLLDSWTLKMGLIACPETSVRNCHYSLRSNPERRSFSSTARRKIDIIQDVPLATEPGISLIILPLMMLLQRNLKRTTDTFLFISHTTNAILFKFHCNIFIGVRIIKKMPGSVASGTHCIYSEIFVMWGKYECRS